MDSVPEDQIARVKISPPGVILSRHLRGHESQYGFMASESCGMNQNGATPEPLQTVHLPVLVG